MAPDEEAGPAADRVDPLQQAKDAMARGDLLQAEQILRQAVDDARDGGDEEVVARAAILLADDLRRLNRHEEAVPFYMESITVAQLHDLEDLTIDSLRGLGYAHFRRGDVYSAQEYFLEGLERARKVDDVPRQVRLSIALGDVFNESGDYTKAIGRYTDARTLVESQQTPSTVDLLHTRINLCEAYLHLQNPRKALTLAEEATSIADEQGLQRLGAWARMYWAQALLQLGELDNVAHQLTLAEQALEGSGDRLGRLTIDKVRAQLLVRTGGAAAGLAAFEPVQKALQELDYPLQLVVFLIDLAEELIGSGALDAAQRILTEAAPVVRGLELTQLEKRLEELDARRQEQARAADAAGGGP